MSCPFVSNTLCTWWGVSTSRCCPKVSLETFTNRVVAITTHKQLGQPKVTWSNRLRKTQLALGCPPTSESTVLKLSRSPRSPPGGDSPSVCCPYLGGGPEAPSLLCPSPHLVTSLLCWDCCFSHPKALPSPLFPASPGAPLALKGDLGYWLEPPPQETPAPVGEKMEPERENFIFKLQLT